MLGTELAGELLSTQRAHTASEDYLKRPVTGPLIVRRCSADQLLQWLAASAAHAEPIYVQSAAGQGWLVDATRKSVRGNPLALVEILPGIVSMFTLVSRNTEPMGVVREIPYDQWLYWLARFSTGAHLLEGSDETVVTVKRGVASPTHGRDFARLTVIYARPLDVQQAAQLARTDCDTVRRFLNASSLLGRITVVITTTEPHALKTNPNVQSVINQPPRSSNLFSRLLSRIRGRHV